MEWNRWAGMAIILQFLLTFPSSGLKLGECGTAVCDDMVVYPG